MRKLIFILLFLFATHVSAQTETKEDFLNQVAPLIELGWENGFYLFKSAKIELRYLAFHSKYVSNTIVAEMHSNAMNDTAIAEWEIKKLNQAQIADKDVARNANSKYYNWAAVSKPVFDNDRRFAVVYVTFYPTDGCRPTYRILFKKKNMVWNKVEKQIVCLSHTVGTSVLIDENIDPLPIIR